MWSTISKILLQILISIISDKVLVSTAKTMLVKAVDSGVKKVGITDDDVQDIIHSIATSTLNSFDEHIVKTIK